MESEYINRNDLMRRFAEYLKINRSAGEPTWNDAVSIAFVTPAADVAEVRHGRWIGFPECARLTKVYLDTYIVCSACKEPFDFYANDTERFKYCPNCGAKMDESEKDA